MDAHITDIQRSTERLYGILAGISSDDKLRDAEISELHNWLTANEYLHHIEPFRSVVKIINRALEDNVIDED
jgi:hypothetical protein